MKPPFFSIIIPTFNSERHIEACLLSLKLQTFNDFEIIIIDNNSSDKTKEIIESFNFKSLSFNLTTNFGIIAKSRNFGIKKAVGKYILFLDSDDEWEKNKCETIFNLLSKNTFSYDLLGHSEYQINQSGEIKNILLHGYLLKKPYLEHMLLLGNQFSTSATAIKTSFLKKNNLFFSEKKRLIGVEDFDFWLNVIKHKSNVYIIKEVLGSYRVHSESTLSNLKNVFKKDYVVRIKNAKSLGEGFYKAEKDYLKVLYHLKTRNFHFLFKFALFNMLSFKGIKYCFTLLALFLYKVRLKLLIFGLRVFKYE